MGRATRGAVLAVAVAVATLGVVLAVRGIGDADDEPGTLTESFPTAPPATTPATAPVTTPPDDAAADVTGEWVGRFRITDTADRDIWTFDSLRRLELRIAPGDPDPTVQATVQILAEATPRFFETVAVVSDETLTVSIGTAVPNGFSVAYTFTGRIAGDRIEGTVYATRFPDESRAEGVWMVERVA